MSKIAIIVALEREIAPLINHKLWRPGKVVSSAYRNYESDQGFIVCAGIGGRGARIAAEEIAGRVCPAILISAGVAGSLTPRWRVGNVIAPAAVVQPAAATPLKTVLLPEIPGLQRGGTLVSVSSIAGPQMKSRLATQYQADAVDMEAGFVAEVAAGYGIPFAAVKAISDECDFPLPDLGRFAAADGKFQTSRFVVYSMLRPSTWPLVYRLARNTSKASQELCRVLRALLTAGALGSAYSGVSSSSAKDT